jgi:bifunctional non-homologous end joining protein LigD
MLKEYGNKRRFQETPEPRPLISRNTGPLVFVVQKHAARRLHYDFRLEAGGVLKSWSVPAGPSPDPAVKRLAVMVEDHPIDYRTFEGVIPAGQYGAGQVIVWDEGTYFPEEGNERRPVLERKQAENTMNRGLESGKISFTLNGHRMWGSWTLVKMKKPGNDWLLIKHRDDFAREDVDGPQDDASVLSGLTIEQLRAGRLPEIDPQVVLEPGKITGARKSPFPASFKPMLAHLTPTPPRDDGWIFEPKLDGYRLLAYIRPGSVQLLTRNGMEVSGNYPLLTKDISKQAANQMVLDGEVIALDENGRPCFQCLQQYLRSSRTASWGATPVIYYVFDLLYLDGYELFDVPLSQRKELLSHVVSESSTMRRVAYFEKDGPGVFNASVARGFEGIMAKRRDSLYRPGQRSPDWLKVKAVVSDDFVIGGYTRGEGNRASSFGALLLGYYGAGGKLIYAGHVGTGFDDDTLSELKGKLQSIEIKKCPFEMEPPLNAPTIWVRPELVAEVRFAEWTRDGRLRTPVFLRVREDKLPHDVSRSEFTAPIVDIRPAQNTRIPVDSQKVLKQLDNPSKSFSIEVEGHAISLTNIDKEFWPAYGGNPAVTKRDLLIYLINISTYILPHLRDRPLTLKRYPGGINGEFFYQRHWDDHRPDFVEAVSLKLENEGMREHLMCNNLATLIWLGQIGSIEFHTWFSRISPGPEKRAGDPASNDPEDITDYPDFIIFDLDPYIYSGKEQRGAEPELNRAAFKAVSRVAAWLKEILDSLSLSAFVKTSGRTGLHIYVPIERKLTYRDVRSAARTIATYALQAHPADISIDWTVEKRTGRVFIDYNQNVRGKTLGAVYAPRVAPEATVSTPLRWDELGKIYPTDFTIFTVPGRLAEIGDLWSGILDAKRDLGKLLKL